MREKPYLRLVPLEEEEEPAEIGVEFPAKDLAVISRRPVRRRGRLLVGVAEADQMNGHLQGPMAPDEPCGYDP